MMAVSWVDALLILTVVVSTVVGVRHNVKALIIGAGAVLLLRPLLSVGANNIYFALGGALLGGLLLSIIGQRVVLPSGRRRIVGGVMGGIGGLLFGLTMLVALATALPLELTGNGSRQLYYPARDMPLGLSQALQRSEIVARGRAVLLYPLLPAPEEELERALYPQLRGLVVVGDPWE